MTIVFVTDKYPHRSRAYIDNQIHGFIKAGVDVYVMAQSCPEGLENVVAVSDPLYNKIFYYGNDKPIPTEILHKADILYCQFGHIGKELLELKSFHNFKAKVAVCFRGADLKPFTLVFQNADIILPVCEYFKQELIKYGCPADKILVHHSAIDFSKYTYKPKKNVNIDQITIISIGRLNSKKGFQYLIEAVDIVKQKYPFIKCLIFGEGEQEEALRKKILQKGLEQNVFFKGYVDHHKVPTILQEADIFALSSCTISNKNIKEGIPNVLMEAMAVGVPVISTFHSGIPELIEDTKTGFLAPERDPAAFAQKIIYLIEHQEFWPKITAKAQKKVFKEHNKDKQNKKILKVFFSLIGEIQ